MLYAVKNNDIKFPQIGPTILSIFYNINFHQNIIELHYKLKINYERKQNVYPTYCIWEYYSQNKPFIQSYKLLIIFI